jgi:hypothetical protein
MSNLPTVIHCPPYAVQDIIWAKYVLAFLAKLAKTGDLMTIPILVWRATPPIPAKETILLPMSVGVVRLTRPSGGPLIITAQILKMFCGEMMRMNG